MPAHNEPAQEADDQSDDKRTQDIHARTLRGTMKSLRDVLRASPGTVLADRDPEGSPLAPGSKDKTLRRLAKDGAELASLQECLYAEGKGAGRRSVLLVLQGMDASGKDGVVKHVIGQVNPAGVRLTSFGKPTKTELAHDFLWRISKALPPAGYVGIFNRSHYEDVLVVKVHKWAPAREIARRYRAINQWEADLVGSGTTVVKCLLHMSPEQQRRRLEARLDDPAKHWKWNTDDLDERLLWPGYMAAYQAVVDKCSTDAAPWYVVPSDRKWYRNWAVGQLLLETLREVNPQWPDPALDVLALKARLECDGVGS
jgi:PPK2 family polyphosphate:nucleotide phosphotransferase